MRVAPTLELTVEQRTTLEQWARARSLPARLVERARIVLLAAAGEQDKEIAQQLGMTAKKVSRWRKRFLAMGLPGWRTMHPEVGTSARSGPARSSAW